MVFAHADKILAITPEELACEMRWRDGRGLVEIIQNVIGHLEKAHHVGALGRIVELQSLVKRVKK